MNTHARTHLWRVLAIGAILGLTVSCAGQTPAGPAAVPAVPAATAAPLVAATAAPTVAPTAAATLAPQALLAHKVGTKHELMPKRIEVVVEIDMADHYFGDPLGQKNPTFTVPVGKTVGIHFHNEGTVMHEFEIGQTKKADGGYERSLFDLITADVFFYYGAVKSEVGGAMFEEIEIEPGIQDVWLRFTVPADLKGEWEIGCFAPEHYEKGMKAKIVFQ